MFRYAGINYSQDVLIKKINAYQTLKKRPLISDKGYCHGLTLLWLNKMAERKEQWFYDMIRYIVHHHPEDYDEVTFEKFLAKIEFGQNPINSGLELTQRHLRKILEMNNIESTNFTGTYENLYNKIATKEHPAMYLVSHFKPGEKYGHAIGVFQFGDLYYVYDSNYTTGKPTIFDSNESAADEIMQRLLSEDKLLEDATFDLEIDYIPLKGYLIHPPSEVTIDMPVGEQPTNEETNAPSSWPSCTIL